MKIDRRMPDVSRTDRFVKILFEIAPAGIEDAQTKIRCVGRRHSIRRQRRQEMEWWLSIMRLLPLHPSAQLELRGGSRQVYLSAAVGPESLSRSVFRRRRCPLCWSFDFERQRESRLAVDCRFFAQSLFLRPVRRCRFSRQISPSYKDRFPPKGSDS